MDKKSRHLPNPFEGIDIFVEYLGQPVVDGRVIDASQRRPRNRSHEGANRPDDVAEVVGKPDLSSGSTAEHREQQVPNSKEYELRVSRVTQVFGTWVFPRASED